MAPGLEEQVPPTPAHGLHSISSNLGSALTMNRQVGTHGALGTERGQADRVGWAPCCPQGGLDWQASTLKADRNETTEDVAS